MKKTVMFIIFLVGLFLLVGCKGGDTGGSVSAPFLGGSTGVFIDFVDAAPPDEVTDGGTFDFDVLVSLRNDGEFDIEKDNIKVSLQGVRPEDFGTYLDQLKDLHPEDDVNGRHRDTEGNIIESTEVYVKFPEGAGDQLNYVGKLVGDRKDFTIRADVCYMYQTKGMAQYCVLRDLLNVRDDSICDPSGSKPVYSSGAPVQLSNFRQTIGGKDKIGFSFDVVHMGNGNLFKYGDGSDAAECPSDPSQRRRNENKVFVRVDPRMGSIKCSGLDGGSNGFVTLVNGKRPIMCTLELSPDRSDFEGELEITLDYNYQDNKDTEILVKHLME